MRGDTGKPGLDLDSRSYLRLQFQIACIDLNALLPILELDDFALQFDLAWAVGMQMEDFAIATTINDDLFEVLWVFGLFCAFLLLSLDKLEELGFALFT